MKRILVIIILAFSLQGCFVPFVAGAAIGGALVYDRRNIHQVYKDQAISQNALQKIRNDKSLSQKSHIIVATFRGTVLIAGQVANRADRNTVVNLVKSVPNVRRVYNEITINAPTSALTRSSDSWITTKVKTQMLAAPGLKSGQFKVVTEDGTVYLMGLVSRAQANQAVTIARNIDGVQRVVKLFDYAKTR